MSAPLRCVVFDLDDTVYLERDYVRSGFTAVGEWAAGELGIVGFGDHAWDQFEGGVRGNVFDIVLGDAGVEPTAERVQAMVEVYRRHEPSIQLLDDASDAIDHLLPLCRLAVVTDGPVDSQRAKARALGVDRWAAGAVFTGELGPAYGKPHPRAFAELERQLGDGPGRFVYVADNPAKDFGGPRELGWETVRVRRPESLHAASASGQDVDIELADLWPLAAQLAAASG